VVFFSSVRDFKLANLTFVKQEKLFQITEGWHGVEVVFTQHFNDRNRFIGCIKKSGATSQAGELKSRD